MMKKIQFLLFIAVGVCFTLESAALASQPPVSCSEILFGGGSSEGCRDYTGEGWTVDGADADCGNIPGSTGGSLNAGGYCSNQDAIIGSCVVDRGTADETRLHFSSGDPNSLENACVRFMAGEWDTPTTTSCTHMAMVGPSVSSPASACTEYGGAAWDAASAEADCSAEDTSRFNSGGRCERNGAVGYCTVNRDTPDALKVYYYSADIADLKYSCQKMNGVWTSLMRQEGIQKEATAELESDRSISVTPDSCDKNKLGELIENKQAIEFAPVEYSGTKGLIIYPGEDADPRAYAVAARMIAEKGYFVAIVPFPDKRSASDPMRADNIIQTHPEITDWAIAGHASGGASASIYAAANPSGKIKAIALWGAFPPQSVNLSNSGFKGLSVRATLDGVLDLNAWNAASVRLPSATYIVKLYGGNHAQFGYYGDQEGDNPAKISRAYQHELFAGATVHLLNRINVPKAQDAVDPLYAALVPETENLGKDGQSIIANLRFNSLKRRNIDNELIAEQEDFQYAKPSFPERGTALVNIKTYPHQIANPFDITLPPVYDGDLWIKMKSQAAFVAQYGIKPGYGGPYGCDQISRAVFEYALGRLDWRTYFRFIRANAALLEYGEDFKTTTGPEWLNQPVSLEDEDKNGVYTLKASRLEVPTDSPTAFGGNFYCKVWSPTAALKFILDHTK